MRLKLTADDVGLNTTFVIATEHAEVTLLTPVLVPAVGKKPVLGTVVDTVTHQLDGMVAHKFTTDMMIDTRSVNEEILINSNDSLARTIGGKLSLGVLLTTDSIDALALVFVVIPLGTVLALLLALGSRTIATGAGVGAVGDVMIARLEAIRRALLSDNTIIHPVRDGRVRLTTLARASARASKHIFRRKNNILLFVDIVTITQRAHSTESPAGTAPSLITDHLHRLALRIFITRIILLRGTHMVLLSISPLIDTSVESLRVAHTKKLGTDILKAHPRNRAGQRCTPQSGPGVHTTHKIHSANAASNSHGNKNSNNGQKLHFC